MDPWKRRFLLETIISRFHVNFWGCSYFFGNLQLNHHARNREAPNLYFFWKMSRWKCASNSQSPGDSKWPFDPLVGGHLTLEGVTFSPSQKGYKVLPSHSVFVHLKIHPAGMKLMRLKILSFVFCFLRHHFFWGDSKLKKNNSSTNSTSTHLGIQGEDWYLDGWCNHWTLAKQQQSSDI